MSVQSQVSRSAEPNRQSHFEALKSFKRKYEFQIKVLGVFLAAYDEGSDIYQVVKGEFATKQIRELYLWSLIGTPVIAGEVMALIGLPAFFIFYCECLFVALNSAIGVLCCPCLTIIVLQGVGILYALISSIVIPFYIVAFELKLMAFQGVREMAIKYIRPCATIKDEFPMPFVYSLFSSTTAHIILLNVESHATIILLILNAKAKGQWATSEIVSLVSSIMNTIYEWMILINDLNAMIDNY